MSTPIYNEPDHANYGPVRRMHLILLYLFGEDLAETEERFIDRHGRCWTLELVERLEQYRDEARAARLLMHHMLDA